VFDLHIQFIIDFALYLYYISVSVADCVNVMLTI